MINGNTKRCAAKRYVTMCHFIAIDILANIRERSLSASTI